MPAPSIKSYAKQFGKSEAQIEKLWNKAKDLATEELGKPEQKFKDDDWAYVTGILKNMLGVKESRIKEWIDIILDRKDIVLLEDIEFFLTGQKLITYAGRHEIIDIIKDLNRLLKQKSIDLKGRDTLERAFDIFQKAIKDNKMYSILFPEVEKKRLIGIMQDISELLNEFWNIEESRIKEDIHLMGKDIIEIEKLKQYLIATMEAGFINRKEALSTLTSLDLIIKKKILSFELAAALESAYDLSYIGFKKDLFKIGRWGGSGNLDNREYLDTTQYISELMGEVDYYSESSRGKIMKKRQPRFLESTKSFKEFMDMVYDMYPEDMDVPETPEEMYDIMDYDDTYNEDEFDYMDTEMDIPVEPVEDEFYSDEDMLMEPEDDFEETMVSGAFGNVITGPMEPFKRDFEEQDFEEQDYDYDDEAIIDSDLDYEDEIEEDGKGVNLPGYDIERQGKNIWSEKKYR